MEPKYPIRVVANKTGLSTHLIRMWERRYHAVEPCRTDTKRRLYSDVDVRRLSLLRRATQAGANIGQIAGLGDDQLVELVASYEQISVGAVPRAVGATDPEFFLRLALDAVKTLDQRALESALLQASVSVGRTLLFEGVIQPLLSAVGEEWNAGRIKVSHEHMATSVIRSFLGHLIETTVVDTNAPLIVVTTPTSHVHELGALMAAVTATGAGWQTMYLGPNLPAEDIASAVRQSKAAAVALSLIYPPDDPRLPGELRALRRLVGNDTLIIIGGESRGNYRKTIEEIRAVTVENLRSLAEVLASNRSVAATEAK